MGSMERLLSKTRKDSAAAKGITTLLELVKRADGNFDLFMNGTLQRANIRERWLPEELCVRYGFCGEEYDAILRKAHQSGRSKVVY